jgi:tRNA threonylcarbamoyladenosine biosynthesis protein TsaE
MKSVLCRSNSTTATQRLAHTLAQQLQHGGTLLLQGNLGSGKTTFVQGLAKSFGITQAVTSPTFTIMQVYPIPGTLPIKQLIHVDLYRLTAPHQLAPLDLPYYQTDPSNLVVVEWFERAPQLWRNIIGTIQFNNQTQNERLLTITGEIANYYALAAEDSEGVAAGTSADLNQRDKID